MSNCTASFYFNTISERDPSTLFNMIWVPTVWAYVHWWFPGFLTIIRITFFSDGYEKTRKYYWNIWLEMMLLIWGWEFFEWIAEQLNIGVCYWLTCSGFFSKIWFLETFTKKAYDMIQGFFSVTFVLVIFNLIEADQWEKIEWKDRWNSIIIIGVATASNLLPYLAYRRNSCWNDFPLAIGELIGVNGQYGPNILMFGYWIHFIIIVPVLGWFLKREIIRIHPDNEIKTRKIMYIYQWWIFIMSIFISPWIFSIFLILWVVTIIGFVALYLYRENLLIWLSNTYGEEVTIINEL